MQDASFYTHRLVQDSDFRIFILQPGGPDDPVSLRMSTNKEYSGPYETISWAWKYPIEETPVYIDGLRFDIPKALHSAIVAVRPPINECAFWADAICVNMSNLKERCDMIKLFRNIFTKSSRVCIWLGDEDSTSRRGMQFVQRCSSIDDLDDVVRGDRYTNSWNAVLSLMDRPWFSRTWVIQEIALARKAKIFCGSDSVTWNEFGASVALLQKRSLLYPETYQIESLPACQLVNIVRNVFKRNDQEEIIAPRLSLQTLVTRLSSFEATDDRDRIYSLVGIARDTGVWSGDDRQDVFTDYSKTFTEVCDHFFLFCVASSRSLDLLFRPWAPKKLRNYLSAWICTTEMTPYGLYSGKPQPERLNADSFVGLSGDPELYHASGYLQAGTVDITKSRLLICTGQRVDIIGETTATAVSGFIPAEWFNLGMGSDTDLPEDFWRTLIADRDIQGHRPQQHLQRYLELAFLQDRGKNVNLDQMLKESPFSVLAPTLSRVQAVTYNRQLIRTENRTLLGLAPAVAQRGDVIYILYGCSVPVILRKQSDGQYLLIGEAYIHGIMDGEALSVKDAELVSIAQSRIPINTFSTTEEEKSLQSTIEGVSEKKKLPHEDPTPFSPLLEIFQDSDKLSLRPRHFHYQPLDILEPNFICRQYRILWKCACGHRGQDIITEYRHDAMQVLVQNLRAEGVSVGLERVGINDPLVDFFKQRLLRIRIIVGNQLNDLKRVHRPLVTDLKGNEYEPLGIEEPDISIQPEPEKKSTPEPRTPTTPTEFNNEQAETKVFTISTGSEMDNNDLLQTVAVGPKHAATNDPYTETPNAEAGSSSGAQTGTNPLTPPAPSLRENSRAVAPSLSSSIPRGIQPRATSAAQTVTSTAPPLYPFDVFYLLLCIKNSKFLTQWNPLDVTNSRRERLLFVAMQKEYRNFKRRKAWFWLTRWVSLKDVIAIKFIKFVLLEDNDIDNPEENEVPGVNDRHYHMDRTRLRTGRQSPYTPSFMMHKFTNQQNCGHGTGMWEQFPKRWGQTPFRGQAPDFDSAWGLLLQEGFSDKRILLVVVLSCLISLLFSTLWARFYSIADAFAIGACILALVACFQAFLSWRDAH